MGFSIIPNISDFKYISVLITKIRPPGQGESLYFAPSKDWDIMNIWNVYSAPSHDY